MSNKYHIFDGDVVKIASCSDCNTKCKHCYISYQGNFEGKKLVEVVSALSPKFEVRINGTEPLLHKEYLEALKITKQGLVLTNGKVFENDYEYISKLLNYNINTIGISYHFDIHDSISMISKSYLDKLFQEIIKRGLNVQIMTTLTSSNYQKVSEYCKYCYDNGIKKIRFTNYIRQGNANNLDDKLIINDNQRNELFLMLDYLRSIYSEEELEIQRCGSFGKNKNSKKIFECNAGSGSVVLTPDLKVYPCLFFTKPGYEIGYYKDGNIYIDNSFVHDSSECNAILKLNKKR